MLIPDDDSARSVTLRTTIRSGPCSEPRRISEVIGQQEGSFRGTGSAILENSKSGEKEVKHDESLPDKIRSFGVAHWIGGC
jgi:hypothetical protein